MARTVKDADDEDLSVAGLEKDDIAAVCAGTDPCSEFGPSRIRKGIFSNLRTVLSYLVDERQARAGLSAAI